MKPDSAPRTVLHRIWLGYAALWAIAAVGFSAYAVYRGVRGDGLDADRFEPHLGTTSPASSESSSCDELREGKTWREVLEARGFAEHLPALEKLARPALKLVPAEPAEDAQGEPPLGTSRIGGAPDLPRSLVWPKHKGAPLAFLAQLNLAEIHEGWPESPLPPDGHLFFFYVADQSAWGFDPKDAGASAVLYAPGGTALEPRTPPAQLAAEGRFPAKAIRFQRFDDLPPLDHDAVQALQLDDGQQDAYGSVQEDLARCDTSESHKVLGWSNPIQSSMEEEAELVSNGVYTGNAEGYKDPRVERLKPNAKSWRLLLQLDSDDAVDMMWGDVGRVYFWIREADLRARRFDRTWTILQCS